MCRICAIKDIAVRDPWPKPLEHYKADINLLVTSAHDEYVAYQSAQQLDKDAQAPDNLLDLLRLMAKLLDQVEDDRQSWWLSPEKRELRRRLEEDCDQKKLSELHKIDNGTTERIEAMNAKLGGFVKWSLGMNGGIWELRASAKVTKTVD